MTTTTHQHLEQIAYDMDKFSPLGRAVDDHLDRARINADDTCHRTNHLWNAVAIGTLEEQLTYEDDADVCKWFIDHGVKF